MKSLILQWLILVQALVVFNVPCLVVVQGQCRDDQGALLLRLRSDLSFSSATSSKLKTWNQKTDCCQWNGVKCDEKGRVAGLDLSRESISGGFDDSRCLFELHHLQLLDLSLNSLNYPPIPSRIGKLANLVHLNLSYSGFGGQIPAEVSNLTRLVVLDLTTYSAKNLLSLKLKNPNLASLVRSLGELQELYLDGVNVSAQGKEWCEALSSSLPNLTVLSMSNCYLSGSIDTSLLKLKYLEKIRLDNNNFSTSVPDFFGEFRHLTFLTLSYCRFSGRLPGKVFQLPTLQTLDLSNNPMLAGTVMDFPENGSLQTLVLSYTEFSGTLPESIGNLEWLSRIDLAACNFTGQIPRSVTKLTHLVSVDLSFNRFGGTIPSFTRSEKLTRIILSNNRLTGELPTHWESLKNLQILDLSYNMLSGRIPSSLFSLPSLRNIQLSNNRFSGQLEILLNASSRNLNTLDVSSNNLQGPISMGVFKLRGLKFLSLALNNFSGSVDLRLFQKLANLSNLDLSYNSLLVNGTGNLSLPQLSTLRLASCRLENFPDLRKQSRLVFLDLSDNQIKGKMPKWIWNVGNGSLMHLNISHNLLTDFEDGYAVPSLSVVDLHSNMFGGSLPLLPPSALYLDYSNNNFSSSIPADIDRFLSFSIYLSLSSNSLTGSIPVSVCNATYLQVLDLSNNELSGEVPECLVGMSSTLGVLNLSGNKLNGSLADSFPQFCAIETLDLSRNRMQGQIPRSLANCSKLEILNIGYNQISDTFPCHLKNISTLRVMVLRSNNFSGPTDCTEDQSPWTELQILDLAMNSFMGELRQDFLRTWKATMGDANATTAYLRFDFLKLSGFSYYQDSVAVTTKGQELELSKILTIYTAIDLSHNKFKGAIPDVIGELKELCILNLSRNALTGSIPSVLGNLQQLESLDLSSNYLTGEIPKELTELNFLSFINLSYNQLVGEIPKGTQFQTFTEESFKGNKGLCGFPLKNMCHMITEPPTTQKRHSNLEDDTKWIFVSAAFGYIFSFWIFIGSLVLFKRWRECYNIHVDKLLFRLFPRLEQRNRGIRTRKQNNRNTRSRFVR